MTDNPSTPTDEELDNVIETRLRLVGVDLDDLPDGRGDPDTGAPSRQQALAFLRSVLRDTSTVLSDWAPPATEPSLAQQVAPPALYPSITHAWTEEER